jgi:hypothetical protein
MLPRNPSHRHQILRSAHLSPTHSSPPLARQASKASKIVTSCYLKHQISPQQSSQDQNMSTSKPQGPRRVGQFLYLRPECIEEYKKCHAAVWPEVLEQIKDSGIEDCTAPLHPNSSPYPHPLHILPPFTPLNPLLPRRPFSQH